MLAITAYWNDDNSDLSTIKYTANYRLQICHNNNQ